jgi:hypothetical protein
VLKYSSATKELSPPLELLSAGPPALIDTMEAPDDPGGVVAVAWFEAAEAPNESSASTT